MTQNTTPDDASLRTRETIARIVWTVKAIDSVEDTRLSAAAKQPRLVAILPG